MKRWALLVLAALSTVGFLALGVWQIERREWKLALIARVEQRVHAVPVAAPGPSSWPTLTRENAEYLRVTVDGHFVEERDTLVRALTEIGAGYWVLTPFQTDDGLVVLVNRGFVGQGQRPTNSHFGHATVTGLLRITEPKGGFLRANDPGQDRWYSRDVQAIAQARNLSAVAPYFIDAEREDVRAATPASAVGAVGTANSAAAADAISSADSSGPAGSTDSAASPQPIAGLTVVTFRNSHLSYAITWFALALMSALFGLHLAGVRPFNSGTTRARP
jgi:surfeit locus 1 family protein